MIPLYFIAIFSILMFTLGNYAKDKRIVQCAKDFDYYVILDKNSHYENDVSKQREVVSSAIELHSRCIDSLPEDKLKYIEEHLFSHSDVPELPVPNPKENPKHINKAITKLKDQNDI